MSKKRKITIATVVIVALGILVYAIAFGGKTETATFTGKITAENINCMVADDQEVLYIDDKKVIIDPGNVTSRGEVGGTSEDLDVCDAFDASAVKKDIRGIPDEGQLDGGEELVGRTVEVHAAVLKDGSYSLRGSQGYYVKTVN